jgi:hypothetical protein
MRARLQALWLRNVIGAVVAAAAVGAILVIDVAPEWSSYRHTVVPEHVVPDGKSGIADGQTWQVESIRHLNRNPVNYGPPLPAGTVLTVVTLEVSGTIDEPCDGVITDGTRRWKAQGIGGFHLPSADGATDMCTKPGRLQFAFLLPQDAVPRALDVTRPNGQIIVRVLV